MVTKFNIKDKIVLLRSVELQVRCHTCGCSHAEWKEVEIEAEIKSITILSPKHIYYKCQVNYSEYFEDQGDPILLDVEECKILRKKK